MVKESDKRSADGTKVLRLAGNAAKKKLGSEPAGPMDLSKMAASMSMIEQAVAVGRSDVSVTALEALGSPIAKGAFSVKREAEDDVGTAAVEPFVRSAKGDPTKTRRRT